MPKVRDTAIDAFKGLLILLVVLAHNGGSHPFLLEFTHPAEMGMFFMVSGYLIHGKLKLKKRIRGTLLPLCSSYACLCAGDMYMALYRTNQCVSKDGGANYCLVRTGL